MAKKSTARRKAGKNAAKTRRLRAAGRKAARTRRLGVAGRKAATTRRRRAAARKKAASTRRLNIVAAKKPPGEDAVGQCIDGGGHVTYGITLAACRLAGGRRFIPNDGNFQTVDITNA